MTNTETDNLRESILETWCHAIVCWSCKTTVAYTSKSYPVEFDYTCTRCLEKALE